MQRVTTLHILYLSTVLHIILLLYAEYVDNNPAKFGGLKYTDIDWSVVSDGARLIFSTDVKIRAEGWFTRYTGWRIGDPYKRATFRYTPLLPLLLSPTIIHPFLGKLVLVPISLFVSTLLLWDPSSRRKVSKVAVPTANQNNEDQISGVPTNEGKNSSEIVSTESRPASFWSTHLLWTINPFVLNITTRGSPESTIVLLVTAVQTCLRAASLSASTPASAVLSNTHSSSIQSRAKTGGGRARAIVRWEISAALLYSLAISWKLYPVIYFTAIWSHLATRYGYFGWGIWRFGFSVALGLGIVNGTLWSIWGKPFLDQTFLHHLTRLDHRHNFSPYFYPIYLNLFASTSLASASSPTASVFLTAETQVDLLSKLYTVLRHPLTSFLPQTSLVLGMGFLLTPITGLGYTMFVQTVTFVLFNKVCTSQYFIWFLPLIPPCLSSIALTRTQTLLIAGISVLTQAIWLGTAYRLEFLAENVFLSLWGAGILFFIGGVWTVGTILDGYKKDAPRI